MRVELNIDKLVAFWASGIVFIKLRTTEHLRPILSPWLLLLLLLLACQTSPSIDRSMDTDQEDIDLVESELVLMTAELAAENTRLAFIIQHPDGSLVNDAHVTLGVFSIQNESATLTQQGTPEYRTLDIVEAHVHSNGEVHDHVTSPGIYVLDDVQFDKPGIWGIRAEITSRDGSSTTLSDTNVLVVESSSTPSIGSLAPRTQHRRNTDVVDLSELSSSINPNPDVYKTTIAEALDMGRPFVTIFSTPGFCQSRLCGPILEMSIDMISAYGDHIDFIHLEPYDLRALRTDGVFVMSDTALEWGLRSEPFVFVIDAKGRVSSKFEGLFSKDELVRALERVVLAN